MTIAYWILAAITAIVFIAVGAMKLGRPKEALTASGLAWAEDFPAWAIKLIGTAEILGAIGIVAPRLTNIAPALAPVAAFALVVLMIGAGITHMRRNEPPVPFALAALAAATGVIGILTLT